MNNKKLGTNFEGFMCTHLSNQGWWVHFMSPDRRGAQPFDIIAVKNGFAMAIDCKTCSDHILRISRVEENQHYAFQRWMKCGNKNAFLAVLHDHKIYMVDYQLLLERKFIDLNERMWVARDDDL